MILEFARRRNDGVGSNLDGAVAPPFWAYLLSSLELIFPCVLGEVSPEITQGIALWEEPTRLAPGEQIPERTRLLLMGPGAFANGVKSWIGAKSRDQAIWADPSTAEQIAKELGVPHNWWLLPEGMARNSSANGNHNARGTPIRIPARRQSRGKRNRAIRIAARVLRRLQIVPAERNWQAPAAELVPGGEPRASVDTEGTLFLPDAPCDPPNWLLEIARLSDVDLAGRDWSILPARGFRSQKVSFFFGEKKGSAEPDSIAIKMTQHAQFNERLLNEHRALSVLTAREPFAMEGL
ncbi:MAG TPA: hypothetical protein VFR10_08530, partial [bacterium]|nr:hypothetical protein [bacterium]